MTQESPALLGGSDPSESVRKPRLLDLFCCEGGAAVGYHRAGFDVVGVDLDPKYRKRYPFEFIAADALTVLELPALIDQFDVIHASPPCQHASAGTRAMRAHGDDRHPELIQATRAALAATGKPYVIENVVGAALIEPLTLCGTEFALHALDVDDVPLEFWRHRGFESNVPLLDAGGCQHGWYSEQVAGVYGGSRRVKRRPGDTLETLAARDRDSARNDRHGGYVPRSARVQSDLLGIDWMTQYGRFQSLPPIFTEHVGQQLAAYLADLAASRVSVTEAEHVA